MIISVSKLGRRIYKKFIRPRSDEPDTRRQEFIVNTLLLGLCIIAFCILISFIFHQFSSNAMHDIGSLVIVPSFFFATLSLLYLSRKGLSAHLALPIIVFIFIIATYFMFTWSFLLPMAQLMYVFIIILSGVLFRARAAIIASLLVSILVLVVGYLQVVGVLKPDISWLAYSLDMIDAIGAVAVFTTVGLITWIADTEIDRSLLRARSSEASLALERDNLEIKVKERTQELEEEQMIRLMELQRFSELGKLAAGLLHDIANPLTVASLNVYELRTKNSSTPIRQISQSIQYIERYVIAARKQLIAASSTKRFKIKTELDQVLSILAHKALSEKIVIKTRVAKNLSLKGDPIKFSQIMSNLVSNAIESYENADTNVEKKVFITANAYHKGVAIMVEDFGRGLSHEEQQIIFQPFFSTKPSGKSNMGIGLSIVKTAVEQDFRGRITVSSSTRGTTFKLVLLGAKK